MAHAQQHQVAASNTAHALAVDCHAGVEHALYHRTHGLLLARQLSGQMLERMETMLMAFFSSVVSSAMVLPGVSTGRNSGS